MAYIRKKYTINRKTGVTIQEKIIGWTSDDINLNPLCELILNNMEQQGFITALNVQQTKTSEDKQVQNF